jgi:hypothetical protein
VKTVLEVGFARREDSIPAEMFPPMTARIIISLNIAYIISMAPGAW